MPKLSQNRGKFFSSLYEFAFFLEIVLIFVSTKDNVSGLLIIEIPGAAYLCDAREM